MLSLPRTEIPFLIAVRISVLSIALVSQFVLANLLLAEGRGIYAVCVLFGMLSGFAFTPGADRGAQYFVMSGRMSLSEGLSSAYWICGIGSLVASAVMFALVHSGLSFFDKAPTETFYLAMLLVPLVTVSRTTLRQIAGLKRYEQLAAYSLIQAATTLIATVGLVWGLGLGVNGAVVALLAGHLMTIALGVSYLVRRHGLSVRLPTLERLGTVLRYGLRDWMSTMGHAAESTVVALVLGFIAVPAEIGLVALATAIVTRVLVISDAMAIYLAPRVAENPTGAADLSASFVRAALWTAVCLMLAWVAVSTVVVDLLLPDEFSPVVRLSWIMSIGVCLAAASEVVTAHFRSLDRPNVVSWSVSLGLTSTVCLILTLHPVYGLDGAAWAVTVGYLVRGIFLAAAFCRHGKINLFSLFLPQSRDIAIIRNLALQASGRRKPA